MWAVFITTVTISSTEEGAMSVTPLHLLFLYTWQTSSGSADFFSLTSSLNFSLSCL